MKSQIKIAALSLSGFLLPALASGETLGSKQYDLALRAEAARNFTLARERFQQALDDISGETPSAYRSAVLYNLGRMTGYTCDFPTAAKLLLDALEMERGISGEESVNTSKRLFELARLNFDQGKYAEAIGFYERGILLAKKLGIERTDPIVLAGALDELAMAYSESGQAIKAKESQSQADDLRTQNPGKQEKYRFTRYTQACGESAAASGNWNAVREMLARLTHDSDVLRRHAARRAIFHYEYGRALGVTCLFDEAERELNAAFDLDKQAGQPLYFSLIELARLNLDQKKDAAAVAYFERAKFELDRIKAERSAPAAYADMLDEFSSALTGLGRIEEAQTNSEKAKDMRRDNPKGKSHTERTPYGTHCAKP